MPALADAPRRPRPPPPAPAPSPRPTPPRPEGPPAARRDPRDVEPRRPRRAEVPAAERSSSRRALEPPPGVPEPRVRERRVLPPVPGARILPPPRRHVEGDAPEEGEDAARRRGGGPRRDQVHQPERRPAVPRVPRARVEIGGGAPGRARGGAHTARDRGGTGGTGPSARPANPSGVRARVGGGGGGGGGGGFFRGARARRARERDPHRRERGRAARGGVPLRVHDAKRRAGDVQRERALARARGDGGETRRGRGRGRGVSERASARDPHRRFVGPHFVSPRPPRSDRGRGDPRGARGGGDEDGAPAQPARVRGVHAREHEGGLGDVDDARRRVADASAGARPSPIGPSRRRPRGALGERLHAEQLEDDVRTPAREAPAQAHGRVHAPSLRVRARRGDEPPAGIPGMTPRRGRVGDETIIAEARRVRLRVGTGGEELGEAEGGGGGGGGGGARLGIRVAAGGARARPPPVPHHRRPRGWLLAPRGGFPRRRQRPEGSSESTGARPERRRMRRRARAPPRSRSRARASSFPVARSLWERGGESCR